MSRFTEVSCHQCGSPFLKENKELNRRKRLGKPELYCSRSCAGFVVIKNIGDAGKFYATDPEHLAKISKLSVVTNTKYSKEERPYAEYIRRANARKKGDMDLTIPYLQDLWLKQEGRCALSGISLVHKNDIESDDLATLASLDRIDSSLPYVKGNVQFLSCAINLAKGNRTDESVLQFLKLIVENFPLHNEKALAK